MSDKAHVESNKVVSRFIKPLNVTGPKHKLYIADKSFNVVGFPGFLLWLDISSPPFLKFRSQNRLALQPDRKVVLKAIFRIDRQPGGDAEDRLKLRQPAMNSSSQKRY
jgi:hypothetical protein